MNRTQTITGKIFYYEGDLNTGFIVHTSDEHGKMKNISVPIKSDNIALIKRLIQEKVTIDMGACRDNPALNSLGFMLKENNLSPQLLSYVLPLLQIQGFCRVYKEGRSYRVRYTK